MDRLVAADVEAEMARRHHLDFIELAWQRREPYIIGNHIKAICSRIDRAMADYRRGISTFLIFSCPFRHGKSDIVSRYLPAHFLGENFNDEILVSSYSEDFALELSRFSRRVVESGRYRRIYDLKLEHGSSSMKSWKPEGSLGGTQWTGIGGSITGRGYNLGIVDDYLKNRADAESQSTRDKQWEWLTNVFLTRRAPVSITIIIATRWHIDDIIGRIKQRITSGTPYYEPMFPKFEIVNFKAIDEGKYLFPERFSADWYESQKGALGPYGFSALMQGEPVQRGGNMFKVDKIQIVDQCPSDIRYVRSWDLASTNKELSKGDPDYTAGAKVGIKLFYHPAFPDIKRYQIYLKHMVRGRWESPERDRTIKQTAQTDGQPVPMLIEVVGGYKDTFTRIAEMLIGVSQVNEFNPDGDKVARAAEIESEIEGGEFYIERADWNSAFLDEMREFPGGKHDDQVDAVVNAVKHLKTFTKFQFGEFKARGKDEKVDYYKA